MEAYAVDIEENRIVEQLPGVLDMLLLDRTTKENITWATDNYENFGVAYQYQEKIQKTLITGEYGDVIMPRVRKNAELQRARAREMAEVFTPSWICNAQNNLIDEQWFGRSNVFNTEVTDKLGQKTWKTNSDPVYFPKGKLWKDYIRDVRLEVACGEAPYITSRYDATTGEFIPIENRIGVLDRKLRVIKENTTTTGEWLKAAQQAYRSTYAFEWQGDNLLLARESMLITFIESYRDKFGKDPLLKSILYIAYIISWNVWQMDGIKCVVPNSCHEEESQFTDLFGYEERVVVGCNGCSSGNRKNHNGTYSVIKDWTKKDPQTNRRGLRIRFVDLIK